MGPDIFFLAEEAYIHNEKHWSWVWVYTQSDRGSSCFRVAHRITHKASIVGPWL